MFTGIVEERGSVIRPGERLEIWAPKVASDSEPGASVAVNGVCLTVVERRDGSLVFDLSSETLARSSLGRLRSGHPVNLERPVTMLTRLGGHLVQGHVDGVGEVVAARDESPGRHITVRVPDELCRYLVEKGSIAVDGVSLTVTGVDGNRFGVALVPFTLQGTALGEARVGDLVNLEVDVIAKYVEGLVRRAG
jgi:riboflavin synthase